MNINLYSLNFSLYILSFRQLILSPNITALFSSKFPNIEKNNKTMENNKIPLFFSIGGDTRIRTGDQSFADSCLSHLAMSPYLIICSIFLYRTWSGKRGSNPRPLPWQGSALSTELFPHIFIYTIICLSI